MKKSYYIFKHGRLIRKNNTVYFEYSDNQESDDNGKKLRRKSIPIETIQSIFIFGECVLNTKAINFLLKNNITVHFFDYYGHFRGCLYPKEYLNSGLMLVKQVESFLNKDQRLYIAKEFVKSSTHNMLKNVKYYQKKYGGFDEIINALEFLEKQIHESYDILSLMGVEGKIKENYFKCWNAIIKSNRDLFKFEKRERKPPPNPINALISFGNSLMYSTTLNEIYHTQLNPTISFLHEPSYRRFSLALDIAEIFKPLIVDRAIFSMINHRRISEDDFDENLNYVILSEEGKKAFIEEYEKKLETTIKHLTLKRNVSYKTLIRLECYKLMKHFIGEKKYEGFKIWW